MKRWPLLVIFSCLALLAGWGQAAGWSLQPHSRFGFRAVVEGEPFTAEFQRYTVNPVVDAAGMPTGFDLTVELREVDSGNAERDREMMGREWFDVAAHPVAHFLSTTVGTGAQGRFVVAGELRIKGAARAIEIPFDWQSTGAGAVMRGAIDLDRRWFGIGPEDDTSVGATVSVFFNLAWDAR
jgi:polyisoprenoid-binding protein YceI